MFRSKDTHICTVRRPNSTSFLPPLRHDSRFARWLRNFRKWCLISEHHPRSTAFYMSRLEILQVRRHHVRTHPYIIHPFSRFRMFYEMWMCFVFFILLLYQPLCAGFNIDEMFAWHHANNMAFILCTPDIIMTFFTGYVVSSTRTVVMEPSKIAKNYIFGILFIADVLSSLPDIGAMLNFNFTVRRMLDILAMLKITRLPTLFQYLMQSAEICKLENNFFHVVKFLFIIYLVFHWFTCIHILIPQFRRLFNFGFAEFSWILRHEIKLNEHFITMYSKTFYRTAGQIMGIDVDVFDSGLWEELLIDIITYIFGKILMLFILVYCLYTLLNQRSLETKYVETMSQVSGFMRHKRLPLAMQNRLLQYYDYKYHRKYFRENVIGGFLSDKLKRDIQSHVCKRLVLSVSLFKELPPEIIETLLSHLKPEIFLPHDIIIKARAVGDCMYFLSCGTVCVTTPSGKEICHLQDGAYFGEICLLIKGKTRTTNIVAIETCEVYRLDSKAFRHCFNKNRKLLIKIEEIALQRLEATELAEQQYTSRFVGEHIKD